MYFTHPPFLYVLTANGVVHLPELARRLILRFLSAAIALCKHGKQEENRAACPLLGRGSGSYKARGTP
jgi:hypothetical protein